MLLLTKEIERKLRKNANNPDEDHKPAVKFFTPDAAATWLLTELHEDGMAFGLCDLGMGCPELGWVSIEEIKRIRGRMGLPVERDKWFRASGTISEYAKKARQEGRILA